MIYASVSVDGGHSFRRNIRVAAAVSNSADALWSLDFGDYEGLAFEADSFYPVWADNSNSTRDNPDGRLHEMDVYTARVRVGQPTRSPKASPVETTPAPRSARPRQP